ncbi:DNA-binding domain-containing protein [Thalassococcus sp. S3]|uniref:HvfC/BufC N-terminal domain-containing protein n=1 Tax=Thalassococcus sp. S3 TaxID=2017482 RepID=UPI0010248FF3|nr:DNA-binding domain-containing protein [Thalassococcus sp. S3]QBF32794.1 DUF2063 domain-containing protein [Thalassococcus sp. S3]
MTVSQSLFTTGLLDPAEPVPEGLSDGQAQPAGRRFNVYRNNVAVSLTEALHTGFPVIAKLLGRENMDGLSGLFLRAHPPSSPLMMHYGDAFPDFIAGLPQLSHLGYLPDVARLELALRRSYHAADAQPIVPETLAETPPDALMMATLTLAPSVEVIRSSWPIHAIWRFNTETDAPKPDAAAQDVLVTRPEFDPAPHVLPADGADFVETLRLGAPFGDALAAAGDGFDLTSTLGLLLAGNALTSLTLKD